MPVLGPDRKSTGSFEDTGVKKLALFYGVSFGDYMHPNQKTSFAELATLRGFQNSGKYRYIEHSNTTIYFPLAYIVPVTAVVIGRHFSNRPLDWFYEARLASALAGVLLTWTVLSFAGRGRTVFFVVSMLPICLFQMSALSADSILIPSALGLALFLDRLLDDADLSIRGVMFTLLAAALVGLGKIAYMPVAVMAPFVALAVRWRMDRTTITLGAGALIIAGIWALWTLLVHNLVFTITVWQKTMGGTINVQKQLALVIHNPHVFVKALVDTLVHPTKYIMQFAGGEIGWFDIKLPYTVVVINLLAVVLAVTFNRTPRLSVNAGVIAIYVAASASALAVFFLIYLQWNPVGAKFIDGVQGRYFIPLLPIVAVCLPTHSLRGDRQNLLDLALVCWGGFSAALTVIMVWHRYWV
jgi:uncharacterized membrane protein